MPSVVDQVPTERDSFYDVKQILCAHRQLLQNVEQWAHQQEVVTSLLLVDLESGKSTTAASLLGSGKSTTAASLSGGANLGDVGVDTNMSHGIPASTSPHRCLSLSDVSERSLPIIEIPDATTSAANEVSPRAASPTNDSETSTGAEPAPETPVTRLGDTALSCISFVEGEVANAVSILEKHLNRPDINSFVSDKAQRQYCPRLSRLLGKLRTACMSKWNIVRTKGNVPPHRNGFVHDLVNSKKFDNLCIIVISCNAVFIAWTSDYARANVHDQKHELREPVDMGFCIFYIIELMLKMICQKWYFLFGKEWRWNYFDAFLVASAVHDQANTLWGSDSGTNASFLRILRLSKMLKLLRMVRLLAMFRELRLIMNSIMGSVKALLWSFLLIFAVLFVFAVCFVQASTEYLQKEGDNVPDDIQKGFDEFWGSVAISMLSMYMAATGGEDWRIIAQPIMECGVIFYVFFLLYIGFYTCVITNTLTSLFVETTISNAAHDQQQIIAADLEHKDKYVTMLKDWFTTIDGDNSGTISMEEFVSAQDHPGMVSFALEMEIDLPDINQFFSVLSSNGQRGVDLDTFVVGCIKLRGAAKSMDLIDLVFAHKEATRYNKAQFENLNERFLAQENLLRGRLRRMNASQML